MDACIDCVTVPGGWERIVVWVGPSGRARHCGTRVVSERSFSELRSGFFVETVCVFGCATSRNSLLEFIFRNEVFHATVHGKPTNRRKVSDDTSVNVRKVKVAETRHAIGEWNS